VELPWSEECLTLGDDDVTKLFARFIVKGYPFVTPPRFRVIVYIGFYYGLGMHWSCIGWNWETFGFFLRWEIGVNWWLFWGQDWDGYGRFDLLYYFGTFEEF
jgi:hypothetical protein